MNRINKTIPFVVVLLTILFTTRLSAQHTTIDKIVAQVGENIILQSEIETIFYQEAADGEVPDDLRCDILEQLITQKLLLIQALKDSVEVGDDRVEYELDRRLNYYESLFGSRQKMEEFYGKTFLEMKEEFREDIRDLLLAQQVQGQIVGELSVSPAEVKAFFKTIPEDSLPYFDAEVELGQIAIIPEPTAEQRQYAREKVEELRQRVLDGESFELLASIYSEDPGSKEDGGYLGCQPRGTYVTEFDAAAFKLQPGEISEVVSTQFGYHIIKMEERQGNNVCLRHILVTPPVTQANVQMATQQLDSIRKEIENGNINFREAASQFSDDEYSNLVGGDMTNPQTGSSFFAIDELDPDVYYAIEKLEPGEMSEIIPFYSYDGKRGLRIILLRSQSPPHRANLDDDYYRMQAAAKAQKEQTIISDWVYQKVKAAYLWVDPDYNGCENIDNLKNASYDIGKK